MHENHYIWKPIGLTPLELVEKFKEKYPEYKNEAISYAGRLDPMAEGILVLLIGEENKNREKYLELKKEYESEIVFGISTDTFDTLGLIQEFDFKEISKDEIEKSLKTFSGKQKQIYPPYSSKAVNGKPLFWWARNKKLDEIEMPEREIEIYSIEILDISEIKIIDLVEKILGQIKNVKGDFRQKEIVEEWEKFEQKYENKKLIKLKIKVSCSSGTYIRRIADDLGRKLETNAFAYSIKRTKIGDLEEKDAFKL